MKKLAYFLKIVLILPVVLSGFLMPAVQYVSAGQTASSTTFTPVTLKNPIKFNSLQELVVAILNIFTTLMVPVIVFFIIYAGFKYVTAQGNPGQIEEASTMLTYAIIGGVLILAAVAIAEIIKNTVASFTV